MKNENCKHFGEPDFDFSMCKSCDHYKYADGMLYCDLKQSIPSTEMKLDNNDNYVKEY